MASGDAVLQIGGAIGPSSSFAQQLSIAGASSPPEIVPVFDFDGGSAIEYIDFPVSLVGYGGGGLTLYIPWAAASATTGVTRWQAAFRRIEDDAEDLDTTAFTYDFNVVDATVASAVGEVAYDQITFTNGADMDSLANLEAGILRIKRDPTHANDTMSGDARLLWMNMFCKET